MNYLKYLGYMLMFIGALNWGLVGLFNFDLVAFLFGDMTLFTRVVYTLVALGGIVYSILLFRQDECVHYHC